MCPTSTDSADIASCGKKTKSRGQNVVEIYSFQLGHATWGGTILRSQRRPLMDLLVFSNVFYCVCAALYILRGYAVHGALLAATGVASFAYHSSAEAEFENLDRGMAIVTFFSTILLLPSLPNAVALMSVIAAATAILFKFRFQASGTVSSSYWWPHFVWHVNIVLAQGLVSTFLH